MACKKCNKIKCYCNSTPLLDIKYKGEQLECISIEEGDNINTALININERFCSITPPPSNLDIINIGEGEEIYAGVNNQNKKQFKSVKGEGDIVVTSDSDEITISTSIDINNTVREIDLGTLPGSLVESEVLEQVRQTIDDLNLIVGKDENILFKVQTQKDFYDTGDITNVSQKYIWKKGKGDWSSYTVTNNDFTIVKDTPLDKPVTRTSDIINDGKGEGEPYITAQDIPEFSLTQLSPSNTFDLLKEGQTVVTVDLSSLVNTFDQPKIIGGDFNESSGELSLVRDDSSTLLVDFSLLVESIPLSTSEITNNGSNGVSPYAEVGDLGEVAISNDYNDLNNKPNLPLSTSDIINDGQDGIFPFITSAEIPNRTSSFVNDGSNGLDTYLEDSQASLQKITSTGSTTTEIIETAGYSKTGKTDKDLPTLGGNDIAISDVYIKVDSQDSLKSQINLFDGKTFDFLGKKVRYDENATPDGVDVIAHSTLSGGFVIDHDYLLDARLFGLKEGQDNGYVFEAISTKIQSIGGDCVVVIPSGTYDSTKQIRVTSNNVTIQLNGTINYTGTEKVHFIEVGTNGGTQLRNFKLLGTNGATVKGYDELQGVTFVQNDDGDCCHVDNTLGVVIKDVAFNNGYVSGVQVARSASIIIDNCTATGSQNNNGISIAFGIANPTDEQYPQSLISNCKAFDCIDFGIASFASINVSFENCYAINCGNYDENQIDAGGGISMEDNAGVPNSITFNNVFKNCHAIDCKNQGFFITGNGVELDDFCTASGTLRDTSGSDPNFFNGNGVFIANAQNVKIKGTYTNNATDGVQILGDVNGLFYTGFVDITSKSNGRHGLFGRGISQLKINGGDYENNTSGGIRFQNNSATYNTGNGEIIGNNISTRFNGDEGSFFTGLKSIKIDNHYVEDEGGNGVRFENTETVRVNSIKAFTSDIGAFGNAVNILASCTNGYIKDTDVGSLSVVNNATNKEEVLKKSDYNWDSTGKLKVNGNEVYHPGNLPPSITEADITGTERQYTQQQQFSIQQVADASTLVWNLRGKQVAYLLTTSGVGNNRTFFNTSLVNPINGGYSKLYYIQDAIGGRDITFGNNFVVSGEIDLRADKVTIIHLNISRDGSKYYVRLEPVESFITYTDERLSNLVNDLTESEKQVILDKLGVPYQNSGWTSNLSIDNSVTPITVPANTDFQLKIQNQTIIEPQKPDDVYAFLVGKRLKISSISGSFEVGETVTGGTSGATGDVIYIGADFIDLQNVSNVLDFTTSETITGGTSTATATVDSDEGSLLTGREGDDLALQLYMTIDTGSTNSKIDTWIDIGGSVGELYRESKNYIDSGTNYFKVIFEGYTLDTFESNGGKIYVRSSNTFDITSVITVTTKRSHKAR